MSSEKSRVSAIFFLLYMRQINFILFQVAKSQKLIKYKKKKKKKKAHKLTCRSSSNLKGNLFHRIKYNIVSALVVDR